MKDIGGVSVLYGGDENQTEQLNPLI